MSIEAFIFPKSNVKVYVRPLPRPDEDYECIKVLDDKKSILAKCLQNFSLHPQQPEFYWKYQVDEVFYNSNQKEVYDVVSGDCIKQALEGNSTVFIGYGQTNSGKSFTMNGLYHNYQQRGIGPRIISDLLETKTKYEHEYNIEFGMSYCEIRGTELYDLLNPDDNSNKINVSKYRKFDNITLMIVTSEEQVLNLLFQGEGRRQINKKAKFAHSHLCSSILTYYIVATSTNSSFPIQKLAKVQVVDLAGVDKTGNITSLGKTAVDVGLANKDLTSLKTFLTLLHPSKFKDVDMQGIRRHSLLVHFLSDTVNGKSFLRFICNIKTNKQYHPITLSMLRITQTIKGIKPTKLDPNTRIQPEAQIAMLQKLLEQYKQEMIRNAIFNDEELENYMCKSRWEHLKRLTEDYLKHNSSELNITSYGQVKPILYIMRDKYYELNEECTVVAKKEYERGLAEASQQQEGSKARITTPPLPNPAKVKRKDSKPSLAKTNTPRTTAEVPESVVSVPESTGELNLAYGRGIGPGISAAGKAGKPVDLKETSNESSAHTIALNREDLWSKFMTTEPAITLTDKLTLAQGRKNMVITEYNNGVQTLNKYHQELDHKKQVLRQAQMRRYLYKHEEYNPDGLILPTDEEKQCLSNMYEAKTMLRQQIDNVTVLQSDIRTANDEILKLQTDIENAFQSYCLEHYDTFAPKLAVPNSKTSVISKNAEDVVVTPAEPVRELYRRSSFNTDVERSFKNQQKIMKKVAKNKQLSDFHKNRKWVSDYKH